LPDDCYSYPQYWDLAFRSETKVEADFIEAACSQYGLQPTKHLFEPGCGGGRLVMEMARRGYQMTACDLNPAMVKYVKQRLKRSNLTGDVTTGDMTSFQLPQPVDAAFCTFNTFRHLISEKAALSHLQSIANCLRPGGLFILGFHIIPLDAEEEAVERWTAKHGVTRVTTTLRVVAFDRRKRRETLRFSLVVTNPKRRLRIVSEYPYRLYTATQFRRLLAKVPKLELCEVFDFWYEIDHPVPFDDELSDAVFVLRRVG